MSALDVQVVGIAGPHVDYPKVISEQLRRHGLVCEHFSMPFTRVRDLSPAKLRQLRTELRKTPSTAVSVYSPGVAEVFLREADIGVYFSGFNSWFDAAHARVIPHLWTIAQPFSGQSLEWADKPSFTVGFMGTAYADSRAARLVSALPFAVKEWILQGRYLRFPDAIALSYRAHVPLKYATTFPRTETIEIMQASGRAVGADVYIVDTGGFTGQRDQIERYAKHMADMTYVLCPRGSENYSFRFYEALRFGRVPVLIDTHTVLPEGIDWDRLAIRVPYRKLHDISEIIACDYRNRSAEEFIARQKLAFDLMADLDSGTWINGLATDVRSRLAAKRRTSGGSTSALPAAA